MASSLIVKIILVLLIFKNDLISFSWIIVVAEFFSIPGYLYLARRYINLSPSVILKSTRGSLAISIIMVLCATLAVRLLNGYQTPFVRLVITLAFLTPAWIGAVFFFRHPLSGEIKTAYHTFFTKIKTVQIR